MTAAPAYETLNIDIGQRVATVTLNRPDKANAMNAVLWRELGACFQWLDEAASVRVVVLTGAGRHFSAGLDLAMFAELAAAGEHMQPARRGEALRRQILTLQASLNAIERCRKPVLAAIHGRCIGGALDMVCCCDMRYCTVDTVFSIKEIDLGMTADVGTLQRLPKLVGDGIVRELAYTGRQLPAAEAASIGLVNQVFSNKEEMMTELTTIARQIAVKSPLAIRGTKEMLLYSRDHSVADGLNYVATWNAGMLSLEDVQRAVAAAQRGESTEFDD